MELLDKYCLDLIDDNPNLMIPWYFIAAYGYYEKDEPLITDALFDRICKRMLKEWDTLEHRHKEYIEKDALEGGTFMGEYPSLVEGAYQELLGTLVSEKKNGTKRKKRKSSKRK